MRICCFQPGATEIVYALGLQDQLYGVTAQCDYPVDAQTKPVSARQVAELGLTLNKDPQVISLDPELLGDVLEDIRRVGRATDRDEAAESLTGQLQVRIDAVTERAP